MRTIVTFAERIGAQLSHDGFALVELLECADLLALQDAWHRFSRAEEAGFHSTILSDDIALRVAVDAAIRSVLEPRISALFNGFRLAFCTFAVKRGGRADSAVPLHQDWSFVDESRFISFGLWAPLLDVDPTNGCLEVVRGSHAAPHPPRPACSAFFYPDLVERLRANYLTALPMRACQALLFDNRLFHCSPPNGSARERVAVTAVLVPAEAPLRYYHLPDRRQPYCVEVFEVADAFYLTHRAPGRPAAGNNLGLLDVREAALSGSAPSVATGRSGDQAEDRHTWADQREEGQ